MIRRRSHGFLRNIGIRGRSRFFSGNILGRFRFCNRIVFTKQAAERLVQIRFESRIGKRRFFNSSTRVFLRSHSLLFRKFRRRISIGFIYRQIIVIGEQRREGVSHFLGKRILII